MKIAITCHYASLPEDHPTWQRAIREAEVVLSDKVQLTSEELLDFVKDADALISGTDFIREDVVRKLPEQLKVISLTAVGFDRVVIIADRSRVIVVFNATVTMSNDVAELAFALMLCCARQLPYHFENTKKCLWKNDKDGMELTGKKLGILGLGAIGKELAKKASAFGMEVLGYSRHLDTDFCKQYGIRPADRETILRECDVISLHMPLTPLTEEQINREAFKMMKKGVILINTSRGKLVQRDDLIDAIHEGIIASYGTDVMKNEPPEQNDPLFSMEQVIITPHMGASTEEAHIKMMDVALTNALDILEGKPCRNIVN